MAVQQHTFPEIEGPDFVRSSEVEAVAEKVLELHGGVGGVGRIREVAEAIRDQELRIMWLLNEKPFNEDTEDDQEPEIAGRCVKAPRLWHDVTGVDFAIWARKHFWDDFNTELRRALILHELEHIEVKRDKNNEPKYAVRKHDVEDFVDVARQYGPSALAGEGARYVRAAALFAGEPEPAIGRRRHRKSAGEVLDEVIGSTAEKILDIVENGEEIAETLPDVDDVLAGDVDVAPNPLACVDNNHVPGCEHFADVPAKAAACGEEIAGGFPCTKPAGHVEAGDPDHDDLPF